MYSEGAKSEARLHRIFSPSNDLDRLCNSVGLTLAYEYMMWNKALHKPSQHTNKPRNKVKGARDLKKRQELLVMNG